MKRPRTIRKYIEYGLVTIGVVFFYLVLIPLVFIPAIIYGWFVIRPIVNAVQTEPLYWLIWIDVKRKSGCSKSNVLCVLTQYAQPGELFDCQLRSEEELARLERAFGKPRPRSSYPHMSSDAIFYRFRRKAGGPGKHSWNIAINLMPARMPARAWPSVRLSLFI